MIYCNNRSWSQALETLNGKYLITMSMRIQHMMLKAANIHLPFEVHQGNYHRSYSLLSAADYHSQPAWSQTKPNNEWRAGFVNPHCSTTGNPHLSNRHWSTTGNCHLPNPHCSTTGNPHLPNPHCSTIGNSYLSDPHCSTIGNPHLSDPHCFTTGHFSCVNYKRRPATTVCEKHSHKRLTSQKATPYWDSREVLTTYNGIVYLGERICMPRNNRPEICRGLHNQGWGQFNSELELNPNGWNWIWNWNWQFGRVELTNSIFNSTIPYYLMFRFVIPISKTGWS